MSVLQLVPVEFKSGPSFLGLAGKPLTYVVNRREWGEL